MKGRLRTFLAQKKGSTFFSPQEDDSREELQRGDQKPKRRPFINVASSLYDTIKRVTPKKKDPYGPTRAQRQQTKNKDLYNGF